MTWLKKFWLRILIHPVALIPLALLIWDFSQGQLTANPIQEITLRTGRTTLILLVLALSATPVNIVFGIRQVLPLRRTLGLYAFMYACLHFLTFVVLDYRFNFSLMLEDVSDKRFVLAGLATFLSLLLLAVTSTKGWQRRLGKNWTRLHWLAYIAAVLAITHFVWQVKADYSRPILYGAIVVILFAVRLPAAKKFFNNLRHRITGK